IISHMLDSGNLDYGTTVVAALPTKLTALDAAITALTDPAVQTTLQKNRGSIIHHMLASGDLDYGTTVVAALPAVLTALDRAIKALTDSVARTALKKNRDSLINHMLDSGDLDYGMAKVALMASGRLEAAMAMWAEQADDGDDFS
ncbi:MAG: hypothetical protein HY696_07630, partial [Deltaproteobacteria bacterium]|nr:hypothetical protein [Deltaproteobacteria bacterium]